MRLDEAGDASLARLSWAPARYQLTRFVFLRSLVGERVLAFAQLPLFAVRPFRGHPPH